MGRNAKRKEAMRQASQDATAEIEKPTPQGSKASTNEDDGKLFQKFSLLQLRMAQGPRSNGLDHCPCCNVDVPIHLNSLRAHYESKRHKNRETIHNLMPILEGYGMGWLEKPDGSKMFWCDECDEEMEAKSKTLIKHIENHGKMEKLVTGGGEDDFGGAVNIPVFKMKTWKVDYEKSSAGLNLQLREFQRLEPPFTLREEGPSASFVGSVRNRIFSPSDLSRMTRVASMLEESGNRVKRSEDKEGSNMKAFGMRRGMGNTGWYKHDKTFLYKLSEELASFISERLEAAYPAVFLHLRKIIEIESLGAQATIGNSPFTSFAITRSYDVRPHHDQDDYDLGFIIWLNDGDAEEAKECSLFAFPEYAVSFYPDHGDVLCFRPGQMEHCTRCLKNGNQLGMAFFQKASLLRQVSKFKLLDAGGVLEDVIEGKGKKPKKTFYEKKVDFLQRTETYAKELAAGTYSMSDV